MTRVDRISELMKFFSYFLLLVLLTTLSHACEKEDILKGVILNRISQFITYRQGYEQFKICIYKDDYMYKIFKKLYKNKEYKKLSIEILSIGDKEHFYNCDIFYSSKVDKNLIKKLNNKYLNYTLLVSDSIDNLNNGFIMALYLDENKIKIAINQEALEKTKLNVNYRLLEVATK